MDVEINRQYLAFTLSGGLFALPIACVREVLETVSVTRLPRCEEHMKGIINVRGAVVPVIDLRIWLQLTGGDPKSSDSVIVLEGAGEEGPFLLGAIADSVQAVIDIDETKIQSGASLVAETGSSSLRGIARYSDEFIAILDPEGLLASRIVLRKLGSPSPGSSPERRPGDTRPWS